VINEVMGPGVVLVSSGDETAFALAALLEQLGLRSPRREPGLHEFFSSGDEAWFVETGQRLLGPELATARRWSHDPT
jgi:glutamate racemase